MCLLLKVRRVNCQVISKHEFEEYAVVSLEDNIINLEERGEESQHLGFKAR